MQRVADESVKINFKIPLALRKRWQDADVPWGVQAKVMYKMFELVVDVFEKHGLVALGALLDNQFELRLRRERERQPDDQPVG